MRTRTSMAGWGSLPGQLFLQAPSTRFGHEIFDGAIEDRELLDATGAEETVLRAGHEVEGVDIGRLAPVELVHLHLVLEVADRSEALDDRARPDAASELDHQDVERVGADVAEVRGRFGD